jgi:hypothetical protein
MESVGYGLTELLLLALHLLDLTSFVFVCMGTGDMEGRRVK